MSARTRDQRTGLPASGRAASCGSGAAARLQDWQREFARALIERRVPQGLREGGAAGMEARFNIYQHAYRARLVEALRSNYPVVVSALGDEGFDALARAYVDARPSRQASIRWFGDTLDDFARRQYDTLIPHPALLDLIRLEWALCLAFDAADEPVLALSDLAQVVPERWPALVFRVHPSARLIDLEWAVEPTWRALNDQPDAETTVPEHSPHATLVWRRDFGPQFRSLDEAEAHALGNVIAGTSFGRMCELAAGDTPDQAPARVAAWLQRWVVDGVLSAAVAEVE